MRSIVCSFSVSSVEFAGEPRVAGEEVETLEDVVEYLDIRADIELVSGEADGCRDKR